MSDLENRDQDSTAPSEPDTPMLSAFVYVARGWQVLPLHGVVDVEAGIACTCAAAAECGRPGSHPLDGFTLDDATTNSNVIVQWWKDHPYVNVGIVAGEDSG